MPLNNTGSAPRQVKPSSKCAEKLESIGIEPNTLSDYNSIVDFFSTVSRKIGTMDLEGMACVKRQVTLLKSNAGAPSSPERIAIKQELPRIDTMIEKRTKQLESGRTGKLKMAAPREFKFIG